MGEAVYPDIKMRVQYGYDLAGRMNSLSYPGGETVRYERDRAGRVTAVVDSVAGRTEMGYDLLGRQVNQRWPNGLSETKTYDSASRLLAIMPGQQDKKGAPTITYTYDARGNRLTMDRSDVGLSTYTYDEISQLLTAALPDGDLQTYTFDAVGNRLSLKDQRGLQTYSYDEADELLEVESDFNPAEPDMRPPLMVSGSEALSGFPQARWGGRIEGLMARLGASDANKPLFKTVYGWDADGNQVSKVGPGNRTSRYDFDSLDGLVGISALGSEPVRYLYNADRQRAATVRGKEAVAERFLHLGRGRQVLGDLDGQGKMTKRYILLSSGQLLAHVDSSANKPAFYHFDALGSTVVLSESSNRITERFVYDPYGERSIRPESKERYGYVGRYGVVTGRGISIMSVRAYAPESGRFLSVDPMRRIGVSCAGKYRYGRNNPVRNIDPEGLHDVPEGSGIWHKTCIWDHHHVYGNELSYECHGSVGASETASDDDAYVDSSVPKPERESELIQGWSKARALCYNACALAKFAAEVATETAFVGGGTAVGVAIGTQVPVLGNFAGGCYGAVAGAYAGLGATAKAGSIAQKACINYCKLITE